MTHRWQLLVPTLALFLCSAGRVTGALARQDDKSAKPGVEHQRLMKLAGDYTSACTFSMGGGKPMESTGTATFKPMLGGRFLMQEDKSTLFGGPFESLKYYGYNAATKKYEGMWSYTGSTALMTLKGTSTDGGKTITFAASFEAGDGAAQKFEIELKELDDKRFSISLNGLKADGSKDSTMETVYTRKK